MSDMSDLQAVVLCGGLGSRLGSLTAQTPKPLLPVGGKPFLERQLFEIARHGVRRIILLAAYHADLVRQFAERADFGPLSGLQIEVSVEPDRAGTGGALRNALDRLDDAFLLFNGDSWFDINILDLATRARSMPEALAALALREVPDSSRYGAVALEGPWIRDFRATGSAGEPGLVNAGVYAMKKELVAGLGPKSSLEHDCLPALARAGRLAGHRYDGFFIDIGTPETHAEAQHSVPARQRRPAVFLDRDGVINEDFGHVGHSENFVWRSGAIEMIKTFNDLGWFVFVVTNQAGVAKGKYTEEDVDALHRHMRAELAMIGAYVDDIRYCPYHVDGIVARYAKESDWRKPEPGMILDLLDRWPVAIERSAMIGDKDSDMEAARRAGVRGFKVESDTRIETLKYQIVDACG
ncbi:HAD-IIIA family hydrolase [Methylosinus sp. Ce-a6]|uniref:HAD-IIIA family hydrolase n=1 Tax=Methylosinus sp. Ce-a6 TaxID=2172005 RepID=UPI0019152DE9|nr:HAD-IIIA family hydrolase [Methylosinus sp. Ce-a6]